MGDRPRLKVAILISGSGSNLQAIIDAMHQGLPITITRVISNKTNAYGLHRAKNANIPTTVISHKDYASRAEFDAALQTCIDADKAELVVLAGFMRILSPEFVTHYAGRLINIHPSLLPKYKGLDTHQRALESGDTEHGASTHFVTTDLDGGPLIAQAKLSIHSDDTVDTLVSRTLELEHQLYPYTIELIAKQRLHLSQDTVFLDGNPLAKNGIMLNL